MTFATLPDLSTIVPGAQVMTGIASVQTATKVDPTPREHGLYFLSWTTITRRPLAAGDSELKIALP